MRFFALLFLFASVPALADISSLVTPVTNSEFVDAAERLELKQYDGNVVQAMEAAAEDFIVISWVTGAIQAHQVVASRLCGFEVANRYYTLGVMDDVTDLAVNLAHLMIEDGHGSDPFFTTALPAIFSDCWSVIETMVDQVEPDLDVRQATVLEMMGTAN